MVEAQQELLAEIARLSDHNLVLAAENVELRDMLVVLRRQFGRRSVWRTSCSWAGHAGHTADHTHTA